VLVTGENSGIGLVTVTELAKLGATVILVARDRSKGQAALEQAKRDSGSGNIHLMLADLSLQVDVRNLALEVQNRFSRLDVLVNNAALVPAVRHQHSLSTSSKNAFTSELERNKTARFPTARACSSKARFLGRLRFGYRRRIHCKNSRSIFSLQPSTMSGRDRPRYSKARLITRYNETHTGRSSTITASANPNRSGMVRELFPSMTHPSCSRNALNLASYSSVLASTQPGFQKIVSRCKTGISSFAASVRAKVLLPLPAFPRIRIRRTRAGYDV
jgi:NAD(P)-dependent dehydrogenase (short-subunit alcohol dehydrogenase family)